MGWTDVECANGARLFAGYSDRPRFYFAHEYHFACERQEGVIATACHGYEFPAALEGENILGVQFHPEKSHRFGMTLFSNFMTKY